MATTRRTRRTSKPRTKRGAETTTATKSAPWGRDRCTVPPNPRSGLRGKALELAEAGTPLAVQIKQAREQREYKELMTTSTSSRSNTKEANMARSTKQSKKTTSRKRNAHKETKATKQHKGRSRKAQPVALQAKAGYVTVADLADKLGWTPFEVRRALRELKVKKVDGRYQWKTLKSSPLARLRREYA